MIDIEEGSGNVYADLGMADADAQLVKAPLATKMGEMIKNRYWTHQQAAEAMGMTLPEVSQMLGGQFRDISESTMRDSLARLG